MDEEDDYLLARALEESLREYESSDGTKMKEMSSKQDDQELEEMIDLTEDSQDGVFAKDLNGQGNHGVGALYTGDEAEGFEQSNVGEWIYPTNYPLREYQKNIVQKALFRNTLVCLPTGLGKTFIAAVVMYNYHRWFPKHKIVFMAHSKPLVAQQIIACSQVMGISQLVTAELNGNMQHASRKLQWETKKIFFLTPQVFNNDLARGIVKAESIKCLVVDEAHKALGNQAYCQVIKSILPFNNKFRVLAMSATPGDDVKMVKEVIQNLLISHLELRTEESFDVQPFTHQKKVETTTVKLDEKMIELRDKFMLVIDKYVKPLVRQKVLPQSFSSLNSFTLVMKQKQFIQDPSVPPEQRGLVLSNFSVAISLFHALEELVVHGLRSFYNKLISIQSGEGSSNKCHYRLANDEGFKALIQEVDDYLGPCTDVAFSPDISLTRMLDELDSNIPQSIVVYSHPKFKILEEVVRKHFESHQQSDVKTKAIVFCKSRPCTGEICNFLHRLRPLVKPMIFIGQSQSSTGVTTKGFNQAAQLTVMKRFREGKYNTLVATCVAEEGLDIGEVDLIVNFDSGKNSNTQIQRSGRTGRKRDGRVVNLVTEGKELQNYNISMSKAKTMNTKLMDNIKKLPLYPNNPNLLPAGAQPVCQEMFLTASKSVEAKKDKTTKKTSTVCSPKKKTKTTKQRKKLKVELSSSCSQGVNKYDIRYAMSQVVSKKRLEEEEEVNNRHSVEIIEVDKENLYEMDEGCDVDLPGLVPEVQQQLQEHVKDYISLRKQLDVQWVKRFLPEPNYFDPICEMRKVDDWILGSDDFDSEAESVSSVVQNVRNLSVCDFSPVRTSRFGRTVMDFEEEELRERQNLNVTRSSPTVKWDMVDSSPDPLVGDDGVRHLSPIVVRNKDKPCLKSSTPLNSKLKTSVVEVGSCKNGMTSDLTTNKNSKQFQSIFDVSFDDVRTMVPKHVSPHDKTSFSPNISQADVPVVKAPTNCVSNSSMLFLTSKKDQSLLANDFGLIETKDAELSPTLKKTKDIPRVSESRGVNFQFWDDDFFDDTPLPKSNPNMLTTTQIIQAVENHDKNNVKDRTVLCSPSILSRKYTPDRRMVTGEVSPILSQKFRPKKTKRCLEFDVLQNKSQEKKPIEGNSEEDLFLAADIELEYIKSQVDERNINTQATQLYFKEEDWKESFSKVVPSTSGIKKPPPKTAIVRPFSIKNEKPPIQESDWLSKTAKNQSKPNFDLAGESILEESVIHVKKRKRNVLMSESDEDSFVKHDEGDLSDGAINAIRAVEEYEAKNRTDVGKRVGEDVKYREATCDSDDSDVFFQPFPVKKKSNLPKKGKGKAVKQRNEFIETEAVLSDDGAGVSSDEENTSGLDKYDSSFVDEDEDVFTQTQSVDMQAKYLQSTKNAAGGRFKIPMNIPHTEDITSQVAQYFDNDYEHDSFCVEDATLLEQTELSALELAELVLEEERKSKRQKIKEKVEKPIKKPLKRLRINSDSSDDEISKPTEPSTSKTSSFVFKTPTYNVDRRASGPGETSLNKKIAVTTGGCANLWILVASRQIASSPEITTELRAKFQVQVCVRSIPGADFVVSCRMGVNRITLSDFCNGSSTTRSSLQENIKVLRTLFARPVVVVEDDKNKGLPLTVGCHRNIWSKYSCATLAKLQQANVTVLTSRGKGDTARLVALLAKQEQAKGHGVVLKSADLSPAVEYRVKFYSSLPGVNVANAIRLASKFSTIKSFVDCCCTVTDVINNICVDKETAKLIYHTIYNIQAS